MFIRPFDTEVPEGLLFYQIFQEDDYGRFKRAECKAVGY